MTVLVVLTVIVIVALIAGLAVYLYWAGTLLDRIGAKLEGATSTPLAGQEFLASWAKPNLTLDDFYYIVRKTMPKDEPESLERQTYLDIVAFILQENGFPSGDKEFTADTAVMKTIRFPAASPPTH